MDKTPPTSANETVERLPDLPWSQDDVFTVNTHIGTITATVKEESVHWVWEHGAEKDGPVQLGHKEISPRTLADFFIYVGSFHIVHKNESELLRVRMGEKFPAYFPKK